MPPTVEEAWSAVVKTLPGEPRPRVVTVSKDAGSLHQYVTDLAAASPGPPTGSSRSWSSGWRGSSRGTKSGS